MHVNAYLTFDGRCEEAFKFYETALGAEIVMMSTFADAPGAGDVPPQTRKLIIHAQLRVGDTVLMASDAPGGRYEKPQGFSISLAVASTHEAERIFAALCDSGSVRMPLQQTFFSPRFGMVTDRFGIPWMVNCDQQAGTS